ncbi:MAG: helix-turn-helix transcriptional regulator [Brevefilum sp.]
MDSKLGNLLVAEMKRRNLSSRDVAKIVGVSHPIIGNIINGEKPSFETCVKIAPFLRKSDVEVMREAGLIKPVSEITSQKEELLYKFDQLNENDRQTILDMMEFLLSK